MVVPEAESPKLRGSESRVRFLFPQLPHDAIGERLETQEPDGKTSAGVLTAKQAFGLLGELREVRREIGDGTESMTSFDYDENLNRVMTTAPNQQKAHWKYAARDLPVRNSQQHV